MKVTVCFDNVRVIVPCGDGDLLVKELIEKAVIRYKKAVGKSNDSWVTVQSLKTCSDGGILDPDDHLNDVVDDREQLTAIYEEQPVNHLHNNGDGASASSVGTSSPDIFQSNNGPSGATNGEFKSSALSDNDVIVTLEDVPSGPGLTVRRGSEPALVGLGEDETSSGLAVKPETPIVHKRWATFGNDTEFNTSTSKQENGDSDFLDPKKRLQRLQPLWSSTGHNKLLAPKFFRDPYRQSLGSRPDMFKWFEAQERQEERLKDVQDGREEPVGGSIEKEANRNVAEKELEIIVTLKNDGEPLGIHVVPDYDDDDKETGLLLQRIEPGSKVSRDGRLKTDDRIIEINGSNLMGISFDRAQEIFRKAMKTNEIQLKVLKSNPPPLPKMPPPLLPKPTIRNRTSPSKPSPLTLPPTNPEEPKESNQTDNSKNGNQENADDSSSTSSGKSESNAASDDKRSSGSSLTENSETIEDNSVPPSPTKKVPPAVPARHPTTALSTKDRNVFSASTNTRKIGKKLGIQLKKGSNGLGFSITSRDNPTGGSVPIYIKNILPKGAAVEDGQLRPGDRLLQVNGIEMSGKTQAEAVTILRNTKMGSIVNLLVSRQSADEPPPKPARENLERKTTSRPSSTSPAILVDHGETSPTPDASNQEYLTFDIALNETCSAGLGVSVKGNTNPSETGANRDLGIFVKAIINGGAASKDGRLKVNDQLIEINGDSLLGLTNQDAMETLRQAMRSIDTVNSHIRLVIARHSEHTASPVLSLNSVSVNDSSFSDETESIENGQNDDSVVNNKFFNCQTATDSSKNIENLQNANLDENGNNSNVIMVPNNERTKPVVPHIDRLRGGHGGSLNNDSYNRAVHSSFEDSSVNIDLKNASPIPERKNSNSSTESKYSLVKSYQSQGIRSLTVNPPEQETVLIEDDSYEQDDGYPPVFSGESHQSSGSHHSQKQEFEHYYRREEMPRQPEQQSQQHQQSRPSHPNHPPPLPPHPQQHHPSQDYSPNPPNIWNEETMLNHNSELSPLSPDFDPNLAFQREGFGRQSMSEKRRGNHDARSSDFYHLAKNNRDDRAGKQGLVRAGSMESLIGNKVNSGTKLHDDMSSRGLHSDVSLRKRSSSMESLPTPDAAFENQGPLFWAADVARSRMCNESFRAAVDRSYNAPHIIQNMETLEEENSDTGSTLGHGQHPLHVHRPVPHKENFIPQEVQGPPPQPVTKATKKKERDNRKSGGLFKGIFKFGKSNKEDKAAAHKDQAAEKENSGKQKNDKPLPEVLEMDRNWKNPRADQERPPDHPKSPYLAPRAPVPRQWPGYREPHYTEPFAQNTTGSRTDKIQQLREEHQRRHQERQGRYPLDEKEEMYERHLQEMERRKFNNQNQHPPPQPPYPEAEYAIVNKIRHPGGRPNPHERMNVHPNYQEKSHAPPYVPPYIPQPNGDERFYPPDYPSEPHPKHPPPYPAGAREAWHGNGYRGQPPRPQPQPRHHRDNHHYKPQDNSQSSHEPWIYIRPGGHSAPPSWPHSVQIESPVASGDLYDYHSNGRYDYADPTYAVISSGRRTPNSSANV